MPVILASRDVAHEVGTVIGERYLSEFYGLRPGVLLVLYMEPGLWERFLESRR